MYASKSFCNVDAFLSNTPGQNSSVGELSTYGQTFTRELGVYQDAAQPGYTLLNLKSANDTGPVALNNSLKAQAIGIVHYVVNKALTTTGQIFPDELLQELVTWAAANNASQVAIGPVLEHDGKWVPNWIRWKSGHVVEDNENTVWLAIDSFVGEYSEYEIVVVPPLDNLDLFFSSSSNIASLLAQLTTPVLFDRVQDYRNGNPDTITRTDLYDWINPLNSTDKQSTPWPVLIYGPAGNNIDAIKDALIDYILANSTHTRQEWTVIFPDIFRRTEFIMAPHWHKYAIPNMTLQHGIYSPITNPGEALAFLKQVANQYASDHVDDNACVMGNPHRSLTVSVVGSAENRDALFRIDAVFEDYINVSSTSIDFNRMDPVTQAWAIMIGEMLPVAEEMTEFTTMPQGMMKMTRDGILYVVKTYNNIQYLVASKRSVYALLGIPLN